jgi:hypothetical protein
MSAQTHRQQELRKALRAMAPLTPYSESEPILQRAAKLTRADLSITASVWLAMVAHIRHRFTDYDELLAEGYDRDAARFFVVDATQEVLQEWGCKREIDVGAEKD